VTVGGQAGIAGHLTIGDNVMLAGRTGVHRDIAPNSMMSGTPQTDHMLTRKIWSSLPYLPELLKRVRKLEKLVANLDNSDHG
jgi:UDP-3-O-[3-hydroxymyristoyl] glucosamine N-acyltransferase